MSELKESPAELTKHMVDHDIIREKHRQHGQSPEDWKSFYDNWAEDYDSVFQSINYDVTCLKRIAELSKRFLPLDASVLDIACGTGLLGQQLKDLGFTNVDGADMSLVSMEKSKKKGLYKKLIEGKITKDEGIMAVTDHTYDAITCTGAINQDHIKVHDGLNEFYRIVKPNGYALFTAKSHVEVPFLSAIEKMMVAKKMELILAERTIYHTDAGIPHYCYCTVIQMVPEFTEERLLKENN